MKGWRCVARKMIRKYCGMWFPSPFLFIRGVSCPRCVHCGRPQSLNSLKLNIPRFLHNCLPISCGDIGSGNQALKVHFMPLGRSCPLKTILLNDLVGCDSPLQIVMAFWGTIIISRGMSHPTQKVWIQTKRVPNCHHYLHRAVTPNWMGSIALW